MRQLKVGIVIGWMIIGLGCLTSSHQANTSTSMSEKEQASEPALSADQLEEIKRTIRVGEDSMISCYEKEMERQGKKLSCKVMVQLVISASGSAEQIEIKEGNIQSAEFTACMIQTVKDWEFPKLPKATPYSFPFAFSPAY